ncbi:hypothetical protein GWK47_042656 [Chionoecetes opilio]|uniref:Uncharacterized protein n=1 Tax=Chionoecetes opilio TaxID=41210 RepID=A0A8J5D014_CHIOP|nr:hypothetical protein GWK47_042656 [Chionoecetes opilio]
MGVFRAIAPLTSASLDPFGPRHGGGDLGDWPTLPPEAQMMGGGRLETPVPAPKHKPPEGTPRTSLQVGPWALRLLDGLVLVDLLMWRLADEVDGTEEVEDAAENSNNLNNGSPSNGPKDVLCLTCASPGASVSVYTRVDNAEPLLTLLGLALRRPLGASPYTVMQCVPAHAHLGSCTALARLEGFPDGLPSA